MNNGFKLLGQVLRLPFYILGVVLWTICIFPIILGGNIIAIVGNALFVPIAYLPTYVLAAFSGDKKPPQWDWDDYWKNCYYRPITNILWLRVGYQCMFHWLCEGSDV